jgi:hypothetical protein
MIRTVTTDQAPCGQCTSWAVSDFDAPCATCLTGGPPSSRPTNFVLRTEAPAPALSAEGIARKAADLVGGDRARTHGDKYENHRNIADLWRAYLGHEVSPVDVAVMMVLLKVARTKTGAHNPDDYIDMTGYAAIAAELAEREHAG